MSKSDGAVVLYTRIPRKLHADLKELAQRSDMTLTMVVTALLAQAVADAGSEGRVKFAVTR